MSQQDALVMAAVRTPVGRAHRGSLRHARPDDMLAHVIRSALELCPGLHHEMVADVIVGCAMPEGPQGMNVARIGLLLADLPVSVPGVTVNRFCASGLEAIALGAARIRLGEADVVVAAGTESMSLVPMMGYRPALNPRLFDDEHVAIAYGMGITAEKVAERWKVSRADQDTFSLCSHQRAVCAQDTHAFDEELVPFPVTDLAPSDDGVLRTTRIVAIDDGPRRDTSLEALAKLRPSFARAGTVTAGNASQMSDGAAAVVLMSEQMASALEITPLARFRSYAAVGVAPEVMGIGPIEAIPRALRLAGLAQNDLDWIELNEAFAAQALAVINECHLDPAKVNPLGGAIALGHPLGATGAIRTATLLHGLRREKKRYGMVTMCIGTGMGAAGIFEAL